MPTYVYKCSKCEHRFEKILKLSEYNLPCESECPECSEVECVTRVMFAPGFGDPIRMGITKMDTGFKEVLQKIDSRAAGSRLKESSTLIKL